MRTARCHGEGDCGEGGATKGRRRDGKQTEIDTVLEETLEGDDLAEVLGALELRGEPRAHIVVLAAPLRVARTALLHAPQRRAQAPRVVVRTATTRAARARWAARAFGHPSCSEGKRGKNNRRKKKQTPKRQKDKNRKRKQGKKNGTTHKSSVSFAHLFPCTLY